MKKYSFMIWIAVLAAVILGGAYFLDLNKKDSNVTDLPETPAAETLSDPGEATAAPETPSAPSDAILRLKVRKPFTPDFTLKDAAGNDVSTADFRGRKLIINFWASWCPPCVYEMPEFQALHNTLDPDDTVLLAINLTDGQRERRSDADAFLKENDLSLNVLYDTEGSAYTQFNITSIPQTFILDEEGLVQYAIMGMTDKKTLDEILERMN